jgi:hypothetical protein
MSCRGRSAAREFHVCYFARSSSRSHPTLKYAPVLAKHITQVFTGT